MKNNEDFKKFLNTLPLNLRNFSDFNMRRYWELFGKPKDFKEGVKRKMFTLEDDGWHAYTGAWNQNDEYEFMKAPNHPTVHYELDWYNSDAEDAKEFRKNYQLDSTSIPWKYVPISHRNGGIVRGQAGLVVSNKIREFISDPAKIKRLVNSIKNWGRNLRSDINRINRYNPEQVPVMGQPGVTIARRPKNIGFLTSVGGEEVDMLNRGGKTKV